MSRRHGIGGLVLIAKAQPVEVLPFEIYTRLWSSALHPPKPQLGPHALLPGYPCLEQSTNSLVRSLRSRAPAALRVSMATPSKEA